MTRKEEIEKASIKYQMSILPVAVGGAAFAEDVEQMNINPSFVAGALYADKTMIKKALAYLQDKFYFNNVFYGIVSTDFNAMEEMYEDFRKSMMEE